MIEVILLLFIAVAVALQSKLLWANCRLPEGCGWLWCRLMMKGPTKIWVKDLNWSAFEYASHAPQIIKALHLLCIALGYYNGAWYYTTCILQFHSMHCQQVYTCCYQEYIIEREGEYPTTLWYCVTTLYGGHDLCNDIHKCEVWQFTLARMIVGLHVRVQNQQSVQ